MTNCSKCNDTGSLSRNVYDGVLDCTHCEAATERAVFNAAIRSNPDFYAIDLTDAWLIYQRAKASRDAEIAALAEAARTMWGWAIQCGEQFTPGHDEVDKANWRLQCDAAQALLKSYPRKS